MDENKNNESVEQNASENNKDKKNGKVKKSAMQELAEWVLCIVVAVAVAFTLKTFVLTIAEVDGDSMKDTLHDKERLLTWKLGYTPKQNDIVIFQPPTSTKENKVYYVKRVIATEHQEVVIDYDKNAVYVDGVKLYEPYIYNNPEIDDDVEDLMEPRGNAALADPSKENNVITNGVLKAVVPEGCVYVMGDNRNNSLDSRQLGFISKKAIEGKVVFRFLPLNRIGTVK